MTALEKQHAFRFTLTPCPRCTHGGDQARGTSFLQEFTLADGIQNVHALICRGPQCGYGEIIGLRLAPPPAAPPLRRSWFREAIARHPWTFAAAAVVNGVALGLLFALT